MKTNLKFWLLTSLVSLLLNIHVWGQINVYTTPADPAKTYLIVKQNGAKFIGKIVSQDAHEILLNTVDFGELYIPKHVIEEIRELLPETDKNYISDDLFASRYFITTNGLPIKKGENYIQWNLYGPDFQFGIADNFSIGIMTSWVAMPIIANAKYSIDLGKNRSMALGLLAGTGSWALPEFGLLLPFVSFTYGNRKNNINFSTGYGEIFYPDSEFNPNIGDYEDMNRHEGRLLLSIAGMAKISDKFSLVFDTFIVPWGPYKTYQKWENVDHFDEFGNYTSSTYENLGEYTEQSPSLALILPGIRWTIDQDRAFQFGFTGFYFDGAFAQFPIPMVQWYRRL